MSIPQSGLRTYGRVKSRALKPRQARLMETRLGEFAPPQGPFVPQAVMPTARDVWLEAGFGAGEHLAAQAARRPDTLFLGAEPFVNGVATCLAHIEDAGLDNVRLHHGDVRDLIARLPDASVGRLYVLFPDPWPKARHHKRRFLQPNTVGLIADRLLPGGVLHVATDHPGYAEHIAEVGSGEPRLVPVAPDDVLPVSVARPITKYETKAHEAGSAVTEFIWRRR